MEITRGAAFVSLDAYKLAGVIVTDRQLGIGSAAEVLELEYMGHKCAGKRIHDFFLKSGGTDYRSSSRSFSKECHLLSKISHPNIVQFLGVYFQEPDETIPILVMEYMPTMLTSFVEHHGVLPRDIGCSILSDIARGLFFLHDREKPIIHRDLSSNNILLSSVLCAKISDLGVARIINVSPLQKSSLTKKPGTEAYMPPEVMVNHPHYNTMIDVFSYGILAIQVFCGEIPSPPIGPNVSGPDGKLIPVSEAERRQDYLDKVGQDHPLMGLILRCIDNFPKNRPSAKDLVQDLRERVNSDPSPFKNKVKMIEFVAKKEEKRILEIKTKGEEKILKIKNEQKQVATKLEQEQRTNRQLSSKLLQQRLKSYTALYITVLVLVAAVLIGYYMYQYPEINMCSSLKKRSEEVRGFVNATMNTCTLKETLDCNDVVPTMIHSLTGNITWKSGQSLKTTLRGGQSVVIDDMLCYGGGYAEDEAHKYAVYCYLLKKNNWTQLSNLPVESFRLGSYKRNLVAVGGITMDGEKSKKVYVHIKINNSVSDWVDSVIPDMPLARESPAVLSLPSGLVVAGGESSIAIYTEESGWYWSNQPLPNPWIDVTLTIAIRTCYVLARNLLGMGPTFVYYKTQLMHTSIDHLLSDRNKITPGTAFENRNKQISPKWKEMENDSTISERIQVTSFASNLITVGVYNQPFSNTLRMYSLSQGSWFHIGHLPNGLQVSTVTINSISPTELLVTGKERDGFLSVYVGSL